MGQLRKILIAHDLLAAGTAALQSALTLAERSQTTVKLVHVVDPTLFSRAVRLSQMHFPPLGELSRRAGQKLEEIAAQAAYPRLEHEVRTGKPFVELIAACRDWQGELLVVGGSGRTDESFLGSTSERIVRKAPVPVLVAKRTLTREAKNFLVPIDFSDCAKSAAAEALSLAHNFAGRIFFLHALDQHAVYPEAYGLEKIWLPPVAAEALPSEGEWQGFFAQLSMPDNVTWEHRTEEGRAASVIVRTAEEQNADLIVMGTHGRSGVAHMLVGSVAEQVVRTARCPVLTIRPDTLSFELP